MFYPLKYFKGLSKTKKIQRKREIKKYGAMTWKNPKAYVGFKTDKGVKTKQSSYTATWKRRFPNAKSLLQKSQATGVPVKYIKRSYDRGMAAWRTGHRPGATQQQWGYARVHSFLQCGKTFKTTDSDIAREAAKKSKLAAKWFSQCKGASPL